MSCPCRLVVVLAAVGGGLGAGEARADVRGRPGAAAGSSSSGGARSEKPRPEASAITTTAAEPASKSRRNRLRGSSVSMSNTVTALSFAPEHEPSYNPAYVTSVNLSPRWSFDDRFSAGASISVASELTRSDWTNDRFYASDLTLNAAAGDLYRIPRVDAKVSGSHSWRLPTSKGSQAASLILGTDLAASASRSWPVLKGLSVSFNTTLSKNFFRYTTSSPSKRILEPCFLGIDDRCAQLLVGDGGRNVSWSTGAGLGGSLSVLDWMSVSLSFGLSHAQLYGLASDDERISNRVDDPTSSRRSVHGGLGVTMQALEYLGVSVGMSTANNQLAADGTYRTPFVNRYTVLYTNVSLALDHFIEL